MSFINELKQLGKAKEEHVINLKRAKAELSKQREVLAQAWAKTNIEIVKRKARRAAKAGARRVFIAKLDIYSKSGKANFTGSVLDHHPRLEKLVANHLQGKYRHLFYECVAVGLKPDVYWTYDCGGVSDWYEFWVAW